MRRKSFNVIIILGLMLTMTIGLAAPIGLTKSISSLWSPNMVRAQLLEPLEASTQASESAGTVPYWVDLVDAEKVSEDGDGVYVAVLDTGLLSWWPWFFYQADIVAEHGKGFTHDMHWDPVEGLVIDPVRDDRGFITHPFKGSGHGTHVVSTIVGYNYNNIAWIQGVAPKAKIIPVLVLDAWQVPYPGGLLNITGGTDEMISEGIYYVADLELDGPVIISMSLGGYEPSPMIEAAIDYAISKGIIFVVAAGNAGDAGMGWPGAYPQVISCAMAGWTEQWVGYPDRWWLYDAPEKLNTIDYWGNNWQLFLDYGSSRPNKDWGQKPTDLDLAAPGCAIVGPYKPYFSDVIGYYYAWGTSMATPHVSAIAALILQNHPDMSQYQMEKLLKNAASGLPLPCDGALAYDVPYAPYYFTWSGTDYGKGFLQADAALKKAK